MNEQFEDYISDALEMVSAWEIPEKDFSDAVMGQARLMAGLNLETSFSDNLPSAYLPLQF